MGVIKKVKNLIKKKQEVDILDLMVIEVPTRSKALYISHQPDQGYRNDRVVIRCDEYREVVDKLSKVINQLTLIKNDYFTKKSLAGKDDATYLSKIHDDYINLRGPLTADLHRLERKRRMLQDKYSIVGRYNDRIKFHAFLLDELYQIVPRSVFEECNRKASARFNELKGD